MATQLQQTTSLDLVPLSPAIGIEVRGIDLRADPDEATRAALRPRRTWPTCPTTGA